MSAFVVLLTIGLGLLGGLSSGALLVLSLLVFSTTVVYAEQVGELVGALNRISDDARSALSLASLSDITAFLSCLLIAQTVWLVYVVILLPPTSWDALAYHLPPVVDYIQAERITMGKFSVFADAYPNNIEMHFLWNMIFLGDDTIVRGTQLWFAAMGTTAVYVLGRDLGLDSENALLGGTLFALTPTVIIQSIVAYVDLAFAALILASYAFLVRYWNGGEQRDLAMVGVATGLFVGTKFTGGLFFLIIAVALPVGIILTDDCIPLQALLRRTAVFAVLAGLFGSFWYLRNIVAFGNPVYPFSVDIGGVTIFDGPWTVHRKVLHAWSKVSSIHGEFAATTTVEKIFLSWFDRARFYSKGGWPVGGYGPQWAMLALPAIPVVCYRAFRRRRWRVLLTAGLFLLPLLLTVEPWKARYNLYLIGFGGVAVGVVRQRVMVDSKQVLTAFILMVLLFSMVMSSTLNPMRHPHAIDQAQSLPAEERTSLNIRGLGPFSPDKYRKHVEAGATVGIDLGPSVKTRTLPYTLYDRSFRTRLIHLGDTSNESEFRHLVSNRRLDYLVLKQDGRTADWARGWQRAELVHANEDHLLFEVQR